MTIPRILVVDDDVEMRRMMTQFLQKNGSIALPAANEAEVRAHLEAENAHTEAFFASRSDLRETLLDEMRGRIKEDDSSVPQNDGPFAYSTRYEVGGEHPRYCRRPRDGGLEDEVVLLDGDALAQGHAYWNLAAVDHAPDHAHIAYAVDLKGSEIYTVKFRTADGSDLEDEIEGTSGNFTWAPDGRHVFYTVLDDNHRPSKVMRHELGTSADRDAVVFEEGDPGFFVGVSVTESERFIVIDSHDHVTSEARLIDARTPTREPTVVRPREAGVEYDVGHHGDHLIIRTNKDGAEDYKVVRCPLTGDWAHDWEDLIPHESGRLIANVLLYARYMVRLERVDALPRIVVRTMSTGAEEALTFDEAVYTLGAHGSLEFDTDVLRFSYGSMATPSRVYDQDMRTGTRTLRKEQEVPSGHDPSAYVVERIMARAADGEAVPVSILRRAGVEGPAPCLLYGYGAYGNSMPAGFSTARLSLVDRGFVFAIAHVRGGMERGYRWYRLGKGRHKGNTFTDFVAAADALIEGGYTSKGRIAARGGSAGGMLMGWLVNNAPDTFGAVVAEVPFRARGERALGST